MIKNEYMVVKNRYNFLTTVFLIYYKKNVIKICTIETLLYYIIFLKKKLDVTYNLFYRINNNQNVIAKMYLLQD